MTNEQAIHQAYELAKERYQELGVDTEEVLAKLAQLSLSIHCWQGDDVHGFINPETDLKDGLTVSGSYPG